jgi:hypothetical protein
LNSSRLSVTKSATVPEALVPPLPPPPQAVRVTKTNRRINSVNLFMALPPLERSLILFYIISQVWIREGYYGNERVLII